MVNVLLNYYNFDEQWAYEGLKDLLTNKKVAIIPLSFRDSQAWDYSSWQALFGKGGEKYQTIISPFFAYGIAESDIEWVNYFTDSTTSALQKIENADVLFFTGGLPEKTTQRLTEMCLVDAVKAFGGVVMGASAGAMFQLDTYHVTPDDDYPSFFIDRGIGLITGIDLEVHFEDTEIQRQCTQKAKKLLNRPVYAMWHQGGLVVRDGKVAILGNVEKY